MYHVDPIKYVALNYIYRLYFYLIYSLIRFLIINPFNWVSNLEERLLYA